MAQRACRCCDSRLAAFRLLSLCLRLQSGIVGYKCLSDAEAMTRLGMILGTAACVSPKQARGKSVDKKADIWAFGVVLFEMFAGGEVCTGETVSDTLGPVLAGEPVWQSLPSNLHPQIHLLLERCLEKDFKDRWSGVNETRAEIQKVPKDPNAVFARSVATIKFLPVLFSNKGRGSKAASGQSRSEMIEGHHLNAIFRSQ
jgi:serine/threonine protein kinase